MNTSTIRTTCSYCSVGCNFEVTLKDGAEPMMRPAKEYPVNLGKSCPKGFNLLKAFQSEDRARRPLLKQPDGSKKEIDWNEAFATFTDRFRGILEEHGPESVAFLSTGQMPMEEMAFLGALGKFGMGMIHGDGNTRQCMATAAVAYKQAFGFDAPPFTYKDYEESDLLIFVGANPAISHPIMWNRVGMNKKEKQIVVIDPRRTKTAQAADDQYQLYPKSDMALLYAVANELIKAGAVDQSFVEAHTEGYEEFKEFVSQYTLHRASRESGIAPERIAALAQKIADAEAVSIWWTMGVNQSHQAVRTAQAIINICLITGNIGRPGTGPNSITGQANAMGSRLYSNTTSLFAGYKFTEAADRAKIAEILGIDESRIPTQDSLPYNKILEKARAGELKGLWIIATNPAHSWINKKEFFEALDNLDFLVVQDLYTTTETAEVADLLLPAAGSGEKDGTLINSERRIGIVQKVMDPPGEAKSDFDIFRGIADAWGCGEMFAEWDSPESVFRILQRSSRGRPCDITGIGGYQELRERGGVQWPYPEENPPEGEERRLFGDGQFFTPNGKAKILFEEPRPMPELPDEEYPYLLLTGRGSVAQFHTQTRTGKVEMLRKLYPQECYVEIHPDDAALLRIEDGQKVKVSSRRGESVMNAKIEDGVKPSQVFIPMHYPETNWLTFPAFDPYSFEPSYKSGAVKVTAL